MEKDTDSKKQKYEQTEKTKKRDIKKTKVEHSDWPGIVKLQTKIGDQETSQF